jgi:hypothetical protein
MAEIKGIGKCGICGNDLQDPTTGTTGPVRHFQGHQLAHKACSDSYNEDDKRLDRARANVARLNAQIGAMTTDRDANQKLIDDLERAVKQ